MCAVAFLHAICYIRRCVCFAAGVKGKGKKGEQPRCAREYDKLEPMIRFCNILPGTVNIGVDLIQFGGELFEYSPLTFIAKCADIVFAA